jgi:hypothetical protein
MRQRGAGSVHVPAHMRAWRAFASEMYADGDLSAGRAWDVRMSFHAVFTFGQKMMFAPEG